LTEPQLSESDIASARQLARDGDGGGAIARMRELVAAYPDDPRAHYELACAFDREGREEDAVAPYKRALDLGLSEPYLQGLLLGLGSTLRNVGAHDEAVALLTDAVARYPDHADLRVFLAFARHSAGYHAGALVTLLDVILQIPEIDLHGYERASRFYTDELREVAPDEEG
jgi:Flp pilus assembly protein TadD